MSENRVLPLAGVHNFRDYGGYVVAGGGRLRTGVLFRSGQHLEATADDLAAVDALGIANIIDLRGDNERLLYPCRRAPGFAAAVLYMPGETTGAGSAPHVEAAAPQAEAPAASPIVETIFTFDNEFDGVTIKLERDTVGIFVVTYQCHSPEIADTTPIVKRFLILGNAVKEFNALVTREQLSAIDEIEP